MQTKFGRCRCQTLFVGPQFLSLYPITGCTHTLALVIQSNKQEFHSFGGFCVAAADGLHVHGEEIPEKASNLRLVVVVREAAEDGYLDSFQPTTWQ
jgi:hypothetical protein